TETVWDIALDGGNRKWVATVNSGVFLLSPDGREQVAHFTAENSPLPSNEVYDVAIDQASGLVYFATPNGVTSFRGTATNFVSELGQSSLTIFPNPWRPEYPPAVTIDGLAFGSEVHSVDAAGRRVRQLDSAGGRVVWDTLDDEGYPVSEGVYFALAGEADSRSGGSGKMVILR
ncbi:MAG: ABC transporter substrate-binding protein, partial [Bacteroidota bacterium]|nr:ABC transporter substrate-binding protein [Bacteroidota bacterium]